MSLKFLLVVFFFFLASCTSQLTPEEYIQKGNEYLQKGEWKSAIIEYKNSIKQAPKNAQARYLLGSVYVKTFSTDAAIKELKRSIELGFDKNKTLVTLGRAYLQGGKYDELLSDIAVNNSLSKDKKVEVYALRATAFLRNRDKSKALAELQKGKKIDENNANLRLAYAELEASNGNIKAQEEWIKPLLDTDNAEAWSQQGRIEQIGNHFEAAENAFTKAIKIRKLVHQDYLSRAVVRIPLKKYKEAQKDLNILKKAGINSPLVTHSEGVIAFYQKKFDVAQSKFDEVLGKFKTYPPSLFLLGLTHYQKKNFESAINALSQYIKTNPENLQANLVLASSYLQSNKAAQAIQLLKPLYNKNPNNQRVVSLLGGAYVRNGQLQEGIALYKKAAKINPEKASTQYQLGSVLIKDKKSIKQGQQALLKALDLDPKLEQANLALFLSYMQSKLFTKATAIANKMIQQKPNESLAYNLLAHAYLAQGKKQKAMQEFKLTLSKFPSDPLTSNNIARLQLRNKDFDGAKTTYLNVLKKFPNDIRSLISLAVLASKQGNEDEKFSYLQKAVDGNPTILSPKMILATELLKLSKYQQAANALININDKDRDNVAVQLIQSRIKLGLKEYDHALVILKKLIAKHPNLASAHFLLGQTYGYLNKKEALKAAMQQVLKLQPDHFAASLILTKLALVEGNEKEFNDRLAAMKKAYPDNPDVLFLEAKQSSKDKNYQSSIKTLEGLLKATPHSEVVMDLAKNKWVSGDKDGAITTIELWVESNPEDKKALMLLAQFYLNQNRFDDANATYAKVDKLIPNNAIVLNNMAWLYRTSNIDQGVKLARKALSIEPNNPFIKDTLAMLLLGANNSTESLKYSKEAAEAQPNFVDIQMNYAKVLIANNEKSTAKEVLKKIYSKAKLFDQRQEIQTLLNTL